MSKVLKFFIYSLPFFNFYIAPNISFSDVGLGFLVVFLIFTKKQSIFELKNYSLSFFYSLFLWSVLAIIILLYDESVNYIDISGVLKNLLRFFIVVYLFKNSRYLFKSSKDLKGISYTWVKVVKLICFLGIIEFLLQFIGIRYSYFIEGITTTTGRQTERFFRISSIFNEPSYLGIYLNFSLLVILELNKSYKVISKKELNRVVAIIILTLVLARSLIGVSLFLFIIFLYSDIFFKRDFFRNKIVIYIAIGSAVIGAFFLNSDRIMNIISFNDGSGNHRILGTYELGMLIYQNFPSTGIGLGQQKNFLDNTELVFQNHFYSQVIGTGSGINNMFILVFFQLGIVGLSIYGLLLFHVFRRKRGIFLFLIISGFGWAFMFNPLYWFCISFLNIIINGKQKSIVHIN